METKQTAPALSADEWNELDSGGPVDDGELSLRLHNGDFIVEITRVITASIPRLIAAANDALPVDSPHKITRDDVEVLRGAITEYEQRHGMRAGDDTLNPLAAKLESLLRPK